MIRVLCSRVRVVVMTMIRLEEDTTPGIPGTAVAGITVMIEIGILGTIVVETIVAGTIVEGTIVVGAAAKKRNLLGHKSRLSTRKKSLCHACRPLAPKVGLRSWINHLLLVVPASVVCLARHLLLVVQTY